MALLLSSGEFVEDSATSEELHCFTSGLQFVYGKYRDEKSLRSVPNPKVESGDSKRSETPRDAARIHEARPAAAMISDSPTLTTCWTPFITVTAAPTRSIR